MDFKQKYIKYKKKYLELLKESKSIVDDSFNQQDNDLINPDDHTHPSDIHTHPHIHPHNHNYTDKPPEYDFINPTNPPNPTNPNNIITTNVNQRKPLLIVMIGNMPGSPESVEHWKKFIENAEQTAPGLLHFSIHPMKLDMRDTIKSKWDQYFRNPNNFMVCDSDHFVTTGWGNISLSFATLMAIQYALKLHNYDLGFYRKVIFIQQGCPLYRFDVLYDNLTRDNRSWFKPRDGHYPEFQYTQPYDFNFENDDDDFMMADIGDWNWFSAIFSLDQNDLDIFFKNGVSTWFIDGTYNCDGKDYINISSNAEEKQHLIEQVKGKWDYNAIEKGAACQNSDETFFGVAFKSKYDGEVVNDHIRYMDLTRVHSLGTKIFIRESFGTKRKIFLFDTPMVLDSISSMSAFGLNSVPNNSNDILEGDSEYLLQSIYFYVPRIIWWRELCDCGNGYPVYIGKRVNFNPEGLKEYYHIRNDRKYILKNGDKVYLDDLNINVEDNATSVKIPGESGRSDIYTELKNWQSLTYNDWSSFSLNPSNVLRGCKVEGIPNLYNIVKTTNSREFYDLIKNKKATELGDKRLTYHPPEYYTCKIRELVNTYNFIKYHMKSIRPVNSSRYSNHNPPNQDNNCWKNDNNFTEWSEENAYRIFTIVLYCYETIFLKLRNFITSNGDVIHIEDENILNIEVGTCVTPDILSSSLASGCLFIRKLVDGSKIDLYTDQLFELNSTLTPIDDKKNLNGSEYLFAPRIFSNTQENSFYYNGLHEFNKNKPSKLKELQN